MTTRSKVLQSFKDHKAHSLLVHDDVKPGDELILFQLPASLTLDDLGTVKINIEKSSSKIVVKGQAYNVKVKRETEHDRSPFVPLLPSQKREKLKLSAQFAKVVTIRPSYDILDPVLPPVVKQSFEQPEGIDHVFVPFGTATGVPTSKAEPIPAGTKSTGPSVSTPSSTKKKKKKAKSEAGQSSAPPTPNKQKQQQAKEKKEKKKKDRESLHGEVKAEEKPAKASPVSATPNSDKKQKKKKKGKRASTASEHATPTKKPKAQ